LISLSEKLVETSAAAKGFNTRAIHFCVTALR